MTAVQPAARTPAEAHVYMDLHPCPVCGSADFDRSSAVVEAEGDLAARYSGPCRECGTPREFLFGLPEYPVAPGPRSAAYGDGTRSRLLDPGEWMFVADRYASSAPATASDDEHRHRLRSYLRSAVAAMDEVAAFLPDDGDLVAEDDFRSELGRRVYAAEPGRFYADRIAVVRQTYADLLAADDV